MQSHPKSQSYSDYIQDRISSHIVRGMTQKHEKMGSIFNIEKEKVKWFILPGDSTAMTFAASLKRRYLVQGLKKDDSVCLLTKYKLGDE